jgi:hypothetical protein
MIMEEIPEMDRRIQSNAHLIGNKDRSKIPTDVRRVGVSVPKRQDWLQSNASGLSDNCGPDAVRSTMIRFRGLSETCQAKESRMFQPTRWVCGVSILAAWTVGAVKAEDAARNVRVVDFGADLCGFVYNPYRAEPASVARSLKPFMDKDCNGTLDNDHVSGWEFSLSEPLNFPYAPHYDLRQKNARLYGGLMIYAVNNPQR